MCQQFPHNCRVAIDRERNKLATLTVPFRKAKKVNLGHCECGNGPKSSVLRGKAGLTGPHTLNPFTGDAGKAELWGCRAGRRSRGPGGWEELQVGQRGLEMLQILVLEVLTGPLALTKTDLRNDTSIHLTDDLKQWETRGRSNSPLGLCQHRCGEVGLLCDEFRHFLPQCAPSHQGVFPVTLNGGSSPLASTGVCAAAPLRGPGHCESAGHENEWMWRL